MARRVGNQMVEQLPFNIRKGEIWRQVRRRAVEHGDPEDAPAENAEDGDKVDQPLSCPEPGVFGLTAGLQDFVKDFDLPSQRIPLKLFDGSIFGVDG